MCQDLSSIYRNFEQCFSHCNVWATHLETFNQNADSAGMELGEGLSICTSNMFPGPASTADPEASLAIARI